MVVKMLLYIYKINVHHVFVIMIVMTIVDRYLVRVLFSTH